MAPRHVLLTVQVLLTACGRLPDPSGDDQPDAGAPDAGNRCTSDTECDDGVFCNGSEACLPTSAAADSRGCVSAQRVECDDGVECTADRCSEERATCVHEPPDADDDGHADSSCVDATGAPLGDDCDDTDPNRYPGNPELCDDLDVDEDCNPQTFGQRDHDGDGYLDARCCNGANCGDDCDDLRSSVSPEAVELCDRLDNDCDGKLDEGKLLARFVDADRDGFGDGAQPVDACPGDVGVAATGNDCDDQDITRNPGQLEICDGQDNDCDDAMDEAFNEVPWFLDADGDNFGDGTADAIIACIPPVGRSLRAGDCDDRNPEVNPGRMELCNGLDDDCNGAADLQIGVNDFEDDDGDGYADSQCGGNDCDDRDLASGDDGTAEICDGRDNDCDGEIDEDALEQIWFRDGDGDGYGSLLRGVLSSCTAVEGYVTRGGDCDDDMATRNPDVAEVCDGVDQDCDGAVDEQADDADGDGLCDARDPCFGGRTSPDADSDGVCDDMDLCPGMHDNLVQPVVNGGFESNSVWSLDLDTRIQAGQSGHLTPGRGVAFADCSQPSRFTQSVCMPRTPVAAPAVLGGYVARSGSVTPQDYFKVDFGGAEVYRGLSAEITPQNNAYTRWSVCLLPEEQTPGAHTLVMDALRICVNANIYVDDVSIETADPTECAAPGTVTHGDFEQPGGWRTDAGPAPIQDDAAGNAVLRIEYAGCNGPGDVWGLLYTPAGAVMPSPALRMRVRGDAAEVATALQLQVSSRRAPGSVIGDLGDVTDTWSERTFCIPTAHQSSPGELRIFATCGDDGSQSYEIDDIRMVSDPMTCP